jgi:hypothetical protein
MSSLLIDNNISGFFTVFVLPTRTSLHGPSVLKTEFRPGPPKGNPTPALPREGVILSFPIWILKPYSQLIFTKP